MEDNSGDSRVPVQPRQGEPAFHIRKVQSSTRTHAYGYGFGMGHTSVDPYPYPLPVRVCVTCAEPYGPRPHLTAAFKSIALLGPRYKER